MTMPVPIVEIAFATNPGATPVWVDVTAYARAFSVRRGRGDALRPFDAGTATITLDNRDRRFDPTYTASPYAPNVIPVRRLRLSATWAAVTYRLFSGYVEGWPQGYPAKKDATVEITASDAFARLGLKKISGEYGEQTEAARVAAILDAAGWPSAERTLLGGQSRLQAVTLANIAALDHLRTVAVSTQARCFASASGNVVWISRHEINAGTYATSQATFGDAGTELPYDDITVDGGHENRIMNEVKLTCDNGVEQTATDATSQGKFFTRTYAQSGLAIADDNEARDQAAWLLEKNKEPHTRIQALRLLPGRDALLWPQALGRDLCDRVTVRRRPPGDPSQVIEQVSHIESISHDWAAAGGTWVTNWGLSAAAYPVPTYWILGDAVYSELGVTTDLRY